MALVNCLCEGFVYVFSAWESREFRQFSNNLEYYPVHSILTWMVWVAIQAELFKLSDYSFQAHYAPAVAGA